MIPIAFAREHQRRRHGDRARDVESTAARLCIRRQQDAAEREHCDSDRDVDEEDPVPAEQIGQRPTEQHTCCAASGEDKTDDPHRLRTLRGLGEEDHDQRERNRGDDGAAEPLNRTGDDEEGLRVGKPAGKRRDRELGDPDQEESPLAVEVPEAAGQQQKAAERQQIRVHDPRERGLGEAEVGPNRRQRHVHDRRVEDDHQISQAEQVQGQPPLPRRQVGHVGSELLSSRGHSLTDEFPGSGQSLARGLRRRPRSRCGSRDRQRAGVRVPERAPGRRSHPFHQRFACSRRAGRLRRARRRSTRAAGAAGRTGGRVCLCPGTR